ncbi:hypothetical protein [Pontibacter roseus]|uniref:hypothetical protein n=1 Tax=Pontibacter roseus TaxID=336989 RepID=UPI00036C436D|nr:hypothetical protein [Pontibacter roseus]
MEHPISVWPIIGLGLIHLLGSRLAFLGGLPRSIWLSGAGGASVAYVFLHLFPELGAGQQHIEEVHGTMGFLQHHVYLMALVGLAVFYGLERVAIVSRREKRVKGMEDKPAEGIFWVHIGSFAIYNGLIGYILYQREQGPLQEMLLFSVAMALHFIINDYGLQEHHRNIYRHFGRWILVAALLLGWGLGFVVELPASVVILLMAFVGGGVVLNVLKEELPEERESRYWAFALGAGAYSILLLSL